MSIPRVPCFTVLPASYRGPQKEEELFCKLFLVYILPSVNLTSAYHVCWCFLFFGVGLMTVKVDTHYTHNVGYHQQ